MIHVTEIILNFNKVLVAIANGLATIGLYRGSDEWEELAETAFNIMVVSYLAEKYGCSISQQYELWSQYKRELLVEVDAGSSLLIGVSDGLNKFTYRYDEVTEVEGTTKFDFVAFGNPSLSEMDIDGLEYVEGVDKGGRVICARKEDCTFLLDI